MTTTATPTLRIATVKSGALAALLDSMYRRPFGIGLLCPGCDEVLSPGEGPICLGCSLPPLSGGSDAATVEVGCHADAYDATADLFHSGDDDFSLAKLPELIDAWNPPAPVNRPSIPNPPYLVQRPGPTFLDLCFSCGFNAAMENEGPVEAPPRYSVNERAAFEAGVREAGEATHARYQEWQEDAARREAEADRFASLRD